MKLEIRAWQNEVGKMLSQKDLDDSTLNELAYADYLKIMLFTGLLDKNGKKIFEGDIVKNIIIFDSVYSKEKWTTGQIIFHYGTFSLAGRAQWDDGVNEWTSLENSMPSELEVIGNIFENSELLK